MDGKDAYPAATTRSKIANIYDLLNALSQQRSSEPLKKLFWSELHYRPANEPLSRLHWPETTSRLLAENPLLLATGYDSFPIIYARLAADELRTDDERTVVTQLMQSYPHGLFIFSDQFQNRWHFVNVKADDRNAKRRLFRRITIGPEERLRTASERLALLDLTSIQPVSLLAVLAQHERAFDVEEVTKKFFDDYRTLFKMLQKDLRQHTNDEHWAHDYALQLLNRCMFLSFIQRKGRSGHDNDFLNVLLNGDLFSRNTLESPDNRFTFSNARIEQIAHFLESYNFTITEDSPLDQEVAVDPEMPGRVYEILVNVSEALDERSDSGIFYTSRTEIDLMCRLSLADYLTNAVGEQNKSLFYHMVFALEPEEKAQADATLQAHRLWDELYDPLRQVTVIDPACGSGAFLLGMLQVLNDVQERADKYHHGAEQESAYARKKRIIEQSLYGVDAMEWATHIAKLRLWLALIIDMDISLSELHRLATSPLPGLTCNIRCGDSLLHTIGSAQTAPSVSDSSFAEIFSDTCKGFDIVIGNPPYVRQEHISNPLTRHGRTTNEVIKQYDNGYKKHLAETTYRDFPEFFQFDARTGKARRPLDARSDLYIYFYLHGLRLLKPGGSFCFLTSNSWLDVGYGAVLQEFLLKHCQIKFILDNQARRSFATADVNTVITLFSAPTEKPTTETLDHLARFVTFNVDFEQVLTAETFTGIEQALERTTTPAYRVYPIRQSMLLEEGYRQGTRSVYSSGMWGGKYLRAPNIYWTLLEKGQGKLVRMGNIARVRFGIKTGANAFFYLDEANIRQWGIEQEFLQPIIKSPRECSSIVIDPAVLKSSIFMCHKSKTELKGTAALNYIQWGEAQGYHRRPSCAGRARWWDAGEQQPFDFVMLRFRDKRNWTPINTKPSLLAGDIMFVGRWHDRANVAVNNALANSTLALLMAEIYGRVNLGDGLLTTYGPEICQFDFVAAAALGNAERQDLLSRFAIIGRREVKSVFEEVHCADRRALDAVIFDMLGLTAGEQDAVYAAVINMAAMRLKKARSLDR